MKPSDHRTTIQRADELYSAGRAAEAASLLLQIEYGEEEQDSQEYANYCNLLGSALAESGQYRLAVQYFGRAQKFYKENEAWANAGLVALNLGNVHKYMSATEIAQQHYIESLECFQRAGNASMQAMVHLSLAHLAADCNDYGSVQTHLDQIDQLVSDKTRFSAEFNWSLNALRAKQALREEKYNHTIELLRVAYNYATESANTSYVAESAAMLGKVLFECEQYAEALRALMEAKELYQGLSLRGADSLNGLIAACQNALGLSEGSDATTNKSRPSVQKPDQKPNHQPIQLLGTLAIAEVEKSKRPHFSSMLDKLQQQGSGASLCVYHSGRAYVVGLSLTGKTVILATDELTMNMFRGEIWQDDEHTAGLLRIVSPITQAGIKARQDGDFRSALDAYRFSLYVALLVGDPTGVKISTANLFMLERNVRMLMEGAPVIGGERRSEEEKRKLSALIDDIAQTSKTCISDAEALLDRNARAQNEEARLSLLVSLRRLLQLAKPDQSLHQKVMPAWAGGGVLGDRPALADLMRRALIVEISQVGTALGRPLEVLKSIYEEFARVYITDIMNHASLPTQPSQQLVEALDGQQPQAEVRDSGFGLLWATYLALRPLILEEPTATLLTSCSWAVEHFNKLRVLAVYGGTGSGHVISYTIAQYLGSLNRDYLEMLLANGQVELALSVAEQTCSRAMVDWMGRTHFNNRLVVRDGFIGSVGEVAIVSVEEIAQAAARTGSPILYYTALQEDFAVWLVQPDGRYSFDRIKAPGQLIRDLFKRLPYAIDPARVTRSLRTFRPVSQPKKQSVDDLLARLGECLIPQSFREILQHYAQQRLVIITDRELNYVPFACLRLNDRYLIDQHDILYWPSVTAWLLCDQQGELRQKGLEQPLPSIVIGDPEFANPYRVGGKPSSTAYQFDALPGTVKEARLVANLLGVEQYTRSAASFENMMAAYRAPRDEKRRRRFVPVLHLASHGVVQMDEPINSFIALADGPLTAGFLYQYDPGIRSQLVVMSCCQTGIGALHPDSIIGLTNAFLICGACSVAATLWQIPDDETQRLMVDFYKELKAGATLSAALGKAQRTMLRNAKWKSPFYWGAFRLSGSDQNPYQFISS